MNREYVELVRQIEAQKVEIERLKTHDAPCVWVTWTPTVTQGVGVAMTVNYARYTTISNVVIMVVRLAGKANGTAGQPIVISGIPAAIRTANLGPGTINTLGTALVIDADTAWYHAAVTAWAANDWRFIAHNVTAPVGAQPNFGLAINDIISFQATYER